MKLSIVATLALSLLPLSLTATANANAAEYNGSLFSDVWATAQENPYSVLPEDKVTFGSFYHFLTDKLQKSSERTLSNQEDVLPYFQNCSIRMQYVLPVHGTLQKPHPTPVTSSKTRRA